MEIMVEITQVMILLVFLKAIIVGSDFNIIRWMREGKNYTQAYDKWQSQKP